MSELNELAIRRAKQEIAALKQLAVAQSAVNLVLAQLLVNKGVITEQEAALISYSYQSAAKGEVTAEEISSWARQQFRSSTAPGSANEEK